MGKCKNNIMGMVGFILFGVALIASIVLIVLLVKEKKNTSNLKKDVSSWEEKMEEYKRIPTLTNGDQVLVSLKDDKSITTNELYDLIKDNNSIDTLIQLIDKKILEELYSDNLEDAKKSVKATMDELKSTYGSDLEDAIKYYTGYASIEAYEKFLFINNLQNLAISDYCKGKISEKEVKNYYEDEILPDIKVKHILITPNIDDSMTDSEKNNANKEAKNKAQELIDTLKKEDKEKLGNKFEELAKKYSSDKSSKDQGGSLGFINKNTLSETYNNLVEAAYNLDDGELSTKIITTDLGYHVVMRVESKEKPEFDSIKEDIIDTLAANYLKSNPTSSVDALVALREKYDIEFIDTNLKKQYNTLIKNQINYIKEQAKQNN